MRTVSRDRTLTSLENQILRDFARELDLDRVLDQLLRRFVTEIKDGFAAYVPLDHSAIDSEVIVQCRSNPVRAKVVPLPFYRRPKKQA